jgi:hypothetical protein
VSERSSSFSVELTAAVTTPSGLKAGAMVAIFSSVVSTHRYRLSGV